MTQAVITKTISRSSGANEDAGLAQLLREARQALGDSGPLKAVHSELSPKHLDDALLEPLIEYCARPQKGLRNRLIQAGFRLAGGTGPIPDLAFALIEALHTGSLIIDDIQDNSPERRGAPALHLLHGLPTALNAGNWLYFWPLAQLKSLNLEPQLEVELYRLVHQAVLDCHYGQALDLNMKVGRISQREMMDAVRASTALKTGSLARLAAEMGALFGGARGAELKAIGELGLEFGVALQMLDDLSGLLNVKRCHKGHEDLQNGRPSWVWAWFASRSDDVSFARLQRAQRAVEARDLHPEVLARRLRAALGNDIADEVTAHLAAVAARVEGTLPNAPDTSFLCRELSLLQQAYL